MTYIELEMLRRDVRCGSACLHTLDELFELGKGNLNDTGKELLMGIKISRGLSIEEIGNNCGIHVNKLEKILNGEVKINKAIAVKLSVLGYPVKAFLK